MDEEIKHLLRKAAEEIRRLRAKLGEDPPERDVLEEIEHKLYQWRDIR